MCGQVPVKTGLLSVNVAGINVTDNYKLIYDKHSLVQAASGSMCHRPARLPEGIGLCANLGVRFHAGNSE